MLYDTIGKNYAQTRRSDSRIASRLLEILSLPESSTVVDIGAGTGSYAQVLAQQGHRVLAIEPSKQMRTQSIQHPAIEWIEASAENLPLLDRSADAAIIMLALHHFQNPQQALQEAFRVTGGGQIVLFTCDPTIISKFWLTSYFPTFVEDVESTFLPMSQLTAEIQSVTGTPAIVIPFPLPHDLSDSFAAVGWARPELYLNLQIRNGISSFAKLDPNQLNQGLSHLESDLKTGLWDQKYGQLRQQSEYDAGYRFVYGVNV